MNLNTTILRDAAKEINRLADYIDKNLPIFLRDNEIKGFFLLRHYEVPVSLILLQRDIIRNWEPRVSDKISGLNAREYDKLRSWLGLDDSFNMSQEFHTLGAFKHFPHEEAARPIQEENINANSTITRPATAATN